MKFVAVVVIVISAGVLVVGWWLEFLEARENTIPMDKARLQQFVVLERQAKARSHDIEHLWVG